VLFDVLLIPGSEHDSSVLTVASGIENEEGREKEPFLTRLFARL